MTFFFVFFVDLLLRLKTFLQSTTNNIKQISQVSNNFCECNKFHTYIPYWRVCVRAICPIPPMFRRKTIHVSNRCLYVFHLFAQQIFPFFFSFFLISLLAFLLHTFYTNITCTKWVSFHWLLEQAIYDNNTLTLLQQ